MSNESRRKLLKSIAAGSGAIVAGKSLPESWSRPVVDSVILPVHAQTTNSPTSPTPDEFFYDVTKLYIGAGIQTFNKYQPPNGERVISIRIEFTPPPPASLPSLDNENNSQVQVLGPVSSRIFTVSSTDVTFTPIVYNESGIGEIVVLGPHDDPDGIDTLTAYEEDSGNDWSRALLPLSGLAVRTITDPLEIAGFLGSGIFNIEYNVGGGITISLLPPGVSSDGLSPVSIQASVRIIMTPAP